MTRVGVIAGVLLIQFSIVVSSSAVYAQSASEETTKQTTRQISDSVSARIAAAFLKRATVAAAPAKETPAEDEDAVSGWATYAFSNVESDPSGTFDVDIHQGLVGGDKRYGDFFFGLSGTYARAEASGGAGAFAFSSTSNSGAFVPYGAWILSQRFFIDAQVGYLYTNTGGITSDTALTSINLNVIHLVNQWILKAKAGHRFTFTDTEGAGGFHANTLLVNGEVGHKLGVVTPFVKAQYEHLFPEVSGGADLDFLFVGGGIKADFSEDVSGDITFEADVINDDVDILKAAVTLRIIF